MRIPVSKIRLIVFALTIAAVSTSSFAHRAERTHVAERRFIQTLHPEIEELPPAGAALAFGGGVALQGDTALVGGEIDHVAIFTREDRLWRRVGDLPCPLPTCTPVSLHDNVAVVIGFDLNSGVQAVFLFHYEQGTWSLTDTINKPRPDIPDLWLSHAHYHDGVLALAVVPPFSNEPAKVYLYEVDANAHVQRIVQLAADDADPADFFGTDVALGEDVIAVGAFRWSSDANDPRTGAVYIFERIGGEWTQTQILTAADGNAGDEFGRHIAIDGDLLLISATNATRRGSEGSPRPTGVVYAFERANGTWTQTAKIAPSPKRVGSYFDFGSDIVLSQGRAVIAAKPLASPHDSLAFEYFLSQHRFAPISYVRHYGPLKLALEDSTFLVGAPWDSPESPIGHVAVYDLDERLRHNPFCANESQGDFCDDFESGTAENWQPYGGAWTVEDREYVGRAGNDQCGTGFSSNETLIRHLDAANVDVQLEMRSMFRVDKGLILRSTSAGDQIELNFRASPFFSDLVVQELVGCEFNFLESVYLPHEMGEVLQVRIRLVDRRLTVWVKQRLVLDRVFPFRAKHGGVGLAVITDHGVSAFDNVRVTVLK